MKHLLVSQQLSYTLKNNEKRNNNVS